MEELVEDVPAIEELLAEVDGRLVELLLEDERTVCRVVAEDEDGNDEELLEVLPFVN